MDFVSDQLQDGTRSRSLTIVDVYTREAVVIEVGQSLKGDDVVRTLNKLKLERGVPKVWPLMISVRATPTCFIYSLYPLMN